MNIAAPRRRSEVPIGTEVRGALHMALRTSASLSTTRSYDGAVREYRFARRADALTSTVGGRDASRSLWAHSANDRGLGGD